MKCHAPGWCAAVVGVEQVEKKWLAEEKDQVYNQVFLHTNRGVCCSFVWLVYLFKRKGWPHISMAWYKTTTCYFHQQGHDTFSFFTGSTSFPALWAVHFPFLSFWVSPHTSKSLHASGGCVSALAAAAFSDWPQAEADKPVVLSPAPKVHPPLQKHPGCIASKCKSQSCRSHPTAPAWCLRPRQWAMLSSNNRAMSHPNAISNWGIFFFAWLFLVKP